MELICKINVQRYGFVDTKETPVTLEKGKIYVLEKAWDETGQVYYYKVIDETKVITTISEDELKIFFEVN